MAERHGTWVSQATPGTGVTSPLEARLALAAQLVKDATGKARSGVFYDGTTNLVTGTSSMAYQIARFAIAQSRSVMDGAIIWANDGTVTKTTTAAPVSGWRKDIIYAFHRDFLTDGHNSDPVIGVKQGQFSNTPQIPSLSEYPGAIILAIATIPADVTSTNDTGVIITQTAPFTAMAGSLIPVRNAAERNTITAYQTLQVTNLHSGCTEQYFGPYDPVTNPTGATPAGWYPVAGMLPHAVIRQGSTPSPLIPHGSMCPILTYSTTAGGFARGVTVDAGTLVIQTPGIYRVRGSIAWAVNNDGYRLAQITKNSTNDSGWIAYSPAYPGTHTANNVTETQAASVRLETGDTLRLLGFQNSRTPIGLAPSTTGPAQAQFLEAEYLGPPKQ